ncbi:BgTH12-06877, partial [Blumeria graminis f. sp. triticale]
VRPAASLISFATIKSAPIDLNLLASSALAVHSYFYPITVEDVCGNDEIYLLTQAVYFL